MKTELRTTAGIPTESGVLKQPAFLISVFVALLVLVITYSNHFNNPFHFDDGHTIVNNEAIRKLSNIPHFFSDATTSSTLPANQAWRPGSSTLNAIDTALSKDHIPDPTVFHYSIFASFLVLGVCLFYLLYQVFRWATPESHLNHWLALFGTAWFCLHTANAETINYIIARADSFSTLMVIISFLLYWKFSRERLNFLFLIPFILGFFVKEAALMFAPLLFFWHFIFSPLRSCKKHTFIHLGVTFLIAVILFFISRAMTPPNWTSGGGAWYYYLITQAYVILHYFISFLLPMNLSADSDLKLITSFGDDRVWVGALFIVTLVVLGFWSNRKQTTKPIAFGIAWFFIALAPTSSIFSFAEVVNDHRPFFPYIGLIMGFVCGAGLWMTKLVESKNNLLRNGIIGFGMVLLLLHAFGTHHRNNVWSSGETLWKDVTEKSPKNGRGWMNYGLALAGKGDYTGAIQCYTTTLALSPYYSYAMINMGIAQSNIGQPKVAEQYYQSALRLDSLNPECYYYYSDFLVRQNRLKEAQTLLEKGKLVSPQHAGINAVLTQVQAALANTTGNAITELPANRATPENYLELSLQLYNAGNYAGCKKAAENALKLRADYAEAYNNICTACNKLGQWDEAIAAGEAALRINANYELAKNNLTFAKNKKQQFADLQASTEKTNTLEAWLNLSLEWYKAGNNAQCIEAAKTTAQKFPDSPQALNNLCACYNLQQQWDLAIVAGEKAVQLKPDYELAKNNLAEAKRGKAAEKK